MILTSEQEAILDFVRAGKGDLLIEAMPGSGKTSTLLEALKVIPQRSILVCAFNKGIAESLKAKLPKLPKTHVVHVKTFHAIGLSIIQAHYPKLKVDKGASETLINRAVAARHAAGDGASLAYPMRRAALKLLRTYKETGVVDTLSKAFGDPDGIAEVGHAHNLFGRLRPFEIERVCDIVGGAYRLSFEPKELDTIDFCDMIWMPLALNLTPPSRYQAILVDEWQDLSEPQFELARKLRAPNGGRMIMVGDIRQAIYSWRGAVGDTVRQTMIDQHQAATLPLTTSFRCSQAVIAEAQELVPGIKAWVNADEGTVTRITLADLPRMMMGWQSDVIHTFVLSRTNADLLDCALFLWRQGVRFQLNAGEDLLEPLFELLGQLDLANKDRFRKSLDAWHNSESNKADVIGATAWKERVDEQRLMLLRASNHVKPYGIKDLLYSILKPGKTGVLLSTVHKVKGLEADRVFLLRDTFARHAMAPSAEAFIAAEDAAEDAEVRHESYALSPLDLVTDRLYETISFKAGPSQEELNIEYVAITRAREHLIWVTLRKWDNNGAIKGSTFDMMVDICRQSDLSNVATDAIINIQAKIEDESIRLDALGELEESKELAKDAVRLKALIAERRAAEVG